MADDFPQREGAGVPGEARPLGSRSFMGGLFGADPLFRNVTEGMGVDVTRTDNGYSVEIPVPGYRPGDIEVTFANDVLVVSGRNERRNFTRSIMLPDEIDPSSISASVAHGMLTLELGRRPETKPRRIVVQSQGASGRDEAAAGNEGTQQTEIVPGQRRPSQTES